MTGMPMPDAFIILELSGTGDFHPRGQQARSFGAGITRPPVTASSLFPSPLLAHTGLPEMPRCLLLSYIQRCPPVPLRRSATPWISFTSEPMEEESAGFSDPGFLIHPSTLGFLFHSALDFWGTEFRVTQSPGRPRV